MKTKPIILPNGIELATLDARVGKVRLLSSCGSAEIRPDEKLLEKLKERGLTSQWSVQSKTDNFTFADINDVLPGDGDYISVNFRALSKSLVPGHWIDWTKDTVLEDSVELLRGATVYANHDFYDINGWLGAVAGVAWDAAGKNSGGVPGINAQYKIDALMNPRIARGLLMSPPAIHSTSMTVLFEFDYSHPDMAAEDRWKFFKNLGEEIDGEIVRLIVTKINEYWEASLVFQGADRLAKMQPKGGEEDLESFSAEETVEKAELQTPANLNEEKSMKLTIDQKSKLGIEFDGEDVPEAEVLKAANSLADRVAGLPENVATLKEQAEAGAKYIELQRAEVKRVATLAVCGSEEKATLPKVIADDITSASFDRLVELKAHYDAEAAKKFGKGRSSLENHEEIEAAGEIEQNKKPTVPKVGLH